MNRLCGIPHRLSAAVLLGTAVLLWASGIAASDLGGLREAKRLALRSAADAGVVQQFRLLVIPVDFADQRFDTTTDWTGVNRRLSGDGESLETFFSSASAGRLHLTTLLAPPVHLNGRRLDYSDRDLGGDAVRSRAMATEALSVTRSWVPFTRVDGDGPDGLANSGDDDGEVDGVLILHAAPGLENDVLNGLIIPLQYWLAEPVVHRGIVARSYAVASLRSGLGIWLHETAHLLGLEDRYDLYLSAPDEALAEVGWGGLGVFSLMAAGHRGIGDGSGAALLDAYSSVQLGWVDTQTLHGAANGTAHLGANPDAATAWRIDITGSEGREYFLLESRGGAAPFDAAVPANRLLIYHVDEDVPEDGQSSSNPSARHLRVRLVEADGNQSVAQALDLGVAEDMFPSDGSTGLWSPITTPSSDGYAADTGATVAEITSINDGIACTWQAPGLLASLSAEIVTATDLPDQFQMRVQAELQGTPPAVLMLRLDNPEGGSFIGGEVYETELTAAVHLWSPPSPIAWIPESTEPGTTWAADVCMTADGDVIYDARWSQTLPGAVSLLNFQNDEIWRLWSSDTQGTATTAWKRWLCEGGIAPQDVHVLALTSTTVVPADWPDVGYDNGADASLLSPPFQPGAGFVLVHHLDTAETTGGADPDGAVVEAILADGSAIPLVPVLGYPDCIAGWSSGALRTREAFVGEGELDPDNRPYWDVATFETSDLPPGDLRLRFRFASDSLWRGRGWFLRSITPVADPDAFRLEQIDGPDGVWQPHWPDSAMAYRRFEVRAGGGSTWTTVNLNPLATAIAHDDLIAVLDTDGVDFWDVRLVHDSPGLILRSRSAGIAARGAVATADPVVTIWPNPIRSGASVQLRLQTDVGEGALALFDLRGRRLRSWKLGPGLRIIHWDGSDEQGRRLSAGRYIVRLAANGMTFTRSLTLIP